MVRPQVLYVEDDELLRMVTTMALEDAGFEVVQACDGTVARHLLSRRAYAHVLSDVSMPGGVSGVAVATEALHRNPACRVVLVSGHPESEHGTLPTGIRFLHKPYRMNQLTAALAAPVAAPGQ